MYNQTLNQIDYQSYLRQGRIERAHAVSQLSYRAVLGVERLILRLIDGTASLFGGTLSAIEGFARRRQAYRDLSRLDDRLLRDIGITRGEIHSVIESLDSQDGERIRRGDVPALSRGKQDRTDLADHVPFVRPARTGASNDNRHGQPSVRDLSQAACG